MIKVAICDDLPEEIGKLKVLIENYALDNHLQISVSGFCDEEEISAVLDDASSYDIIFLDIYMDSLNGLDLAKHITVSGEKSNIIFVSSSSEHALDAFGVNALQYLTKPVNCEKFENAMKIALKHKIKREKTVSILSGNDIIKIPFDNIIYAEAQRNYQKIHLSNGGTETTRISNTKLYELMQERSEFVRLGVSFILNLKFVSRISAKDIVLTSGKVIPVPRGSFAQLKERYFAYYNMGGNI